MNAAQIGMATTEHNISNSATPGFTRQQIVVAQYAGQQSGSGFVGQGVNVSGVKRMYDQNLTTQVRLEQSQSSYLSSYSTALQEVNNLVSDATAGAAPAMQAFFDAANGLANNPGSTAARQTYLSSAQFAVNSFQTIDQRMTDVATGVNNQIASSVKAVNSYAQQIATLNVSIKQATINGQGQQPNDLLDQRDQLVSQLNQEIKATVQQQSDGSLNVYVGSGQPLVLNDRAMQLQAVQSTSQPGKLEIAYLNQGTSLPVQQSSLQGGNLGAYLHFRDQSLEPARNALGLVAMGLADSINQQNRLGQDASGKIGGDLFNLASPLVDKNSNNHSSSGAPTVTISNVSALTSSNYQLKYNGAADGYTLTRLSDNTSINYRSLPQTVDGMTITAPAVVTAGDSFLIRPVSSGARDFTLLTNDPNRVAAAAPMLGSAALTNTGTGKISSGTVNAPPPANANVQAPVSITFTSATSFDIVGTGTGNPTGLSYPTASGSISYNGWTVQITGAPAAGDVFNVSTNSNGSGDNRNVLLMASMQTKNIMQNGTASFQGLYGQLVSDVGTKTHELTVTSTAQDSMLAQTVASQQAVSGVNLDEEAANLMRYQNAYQAAAKAMQMAQSMFAALIAIKT